jgi:hypothetical protein
MFTAEFPYDFGAFVKIIDPLFERKQPLEYGTIAAYTVSSPTDITVFVSGYKEAWCGEYLLSEIEPMTDEEIEQIERY